MAAVAGLYRRKLPSPPAIEFASPEGKRVFSEALQQGNMDGFFSLISYYQTQSEPAYCGLATLSVVLNALAIDPGRKWKGPWRWFDDSMLDCCEPLEKIKVKGITFDQVACLARCNGAKVEAFHTDQSTIEKFRNIVLSCTSLEDCHLIVSYHRGRLQQTGTGHFSPIGGYHAEMDLVLILDVARFKYPPHWVPLTLLWEAMNTIDEATGCHRGFMLLSKPQAASILYTVSCCHESWRTTAKYLTKDIQHVLASEEINSVEEFLGIIVSSAPADLKDFINWIVEVRLQEEGSKVGEEEKARLTLKEDILNQVRGTKLYEHVSSFLLSKSCCKLKTRDSLTVIASEVCCQAAKFFCDRFGSSNATCCKATDTKLLKDNDEKTIVMVSGKVDTQSGEREIDILVPCWSMPNCSCSSACVSSSSSRKHPSADDVLTILLLALPPTTWFGIRKEELKEEISGLLSTISLPPLLQEEVRHLRQQLLCLSAIIRDP